MADHRLVGAGMALDLEAGVFQLQFVQHLKQALLVPLALGLHRQALHRLRQGQGPQVNLVFVVRVIASVQASGRSFQQRWRASAQCPMPEGPEDSHRDDARGVGSRSNDIAGHCTSSSVTSSTDRALARGLVALARRDPFKKYRK